MLRQAIKATSTLVTRLSSYFQLLSGKDQPNGYAGLNSSGEIVGPILLSPLTNAELDATVLDAGQVAMSSDSPVTLRLGDGVTAGGVTVATGNNSVMFQTLTGDGQTLSHNGAAILVVTATANQAFETWAVAVIDPGSYPGQQLKLVLLAKAIDTTFAGAEMTLDMSGMVNVSADLRTIDSGYAEDGTVTGWGTVQLVWAYNDAGDLSWYIEGGGSIQNIGTRSHSEGLNTQAWGAYSHAEGNGTFAEGENAHAEGGLSQAIGHSSHAEGYDCLAGQDFSHAQGYQSKTRFIGQTARASGNVNEVRGSAQSTGSDLFLVTTNATPSVMVINGSAPIILPAQSTWTFEVFVSAYNTTDNVGAGYRLCGCIRRNNAGSTVIVGTVLKDVFEEASMASCDVSITANDTLESLEIKVTGIAAKTIGWHARLEMSEVCAGTP